MSTLKKHIFGDLSACSIHEFGLKHFFFERTGGESIAPYESFNCAFKTDDIGAPGNRKKLFETLGLNDIPTRILNPCHGEKIAVLTKDQWNESRHDVLIATDAALTDMPNSFFIMSTADCLPLLITDTKNRIAGIIHLGWRNIVARFPAQVLAKIEDTYGIPTTDLRVVIGPSIYPCCYIYPDPVQLKDPFWTPYLRPQGDGKYAIDLISPTRQQLLDAGINSENILESKVCTSCQNEAFFSCYVEGVKSGRFPSVIGLTA